MKAIHLICRRDETGQLKNLSRVEGDIWRTGYWDLDVGVAEALVGGWVYLHPAKNEPSEFGGKVLAVAPAQYDGVSHTERAVLEFKAERTGRGQRWRGQAHGMAWTSGIVDAGLAHEAEQP